MGRAPDIFLPRDGANKIASATSGHGELTLVHVVAEDLYVVKAVGIGHQVRIPVVVPPEDMVLGWDGPTFQGQWITRPADQINLAHRDLLHRPLHEIPIEEFRDMVPGLQDPGNQTGFVITHDPDLPQDYRELGVDEYAGWLVTRNWARPVHLDVEPEVVGIDQLIDRWPVEAMKSHSVIVVGCGSIGGSAAEGLARFGIGRVELVDPDRFRWHNALRHVLGRESVGAYKATALARMLRGRWPTQTFNPNVLDVVHDAHELRALLADADLIVCTADGIAARRVVSHLARRAKKPAVLACVLDNGAIGEIVRLRPTPRFGCLLCLRAEHSSRGAMDVEAAQERDYGTGDVHLPMTAVPPDLHLVGTLAAKIAVATLLESMHGIRSQRLPGEYAIVGLQPSGDLAQPFDLSFAGDVRWAGVPAPRPDCPTCNP